MDNTREHDMLVEQDLSTMTEETWRRANKNVSEICGERIRVCKHTCQRVKKYLSLSGVLVRP